jgi:hypothetical protein
MYDPTSGRFNKLDPFVGNTHDPQSLHKYGYVHGDPVNAVDPTGMFSSPGVLGVFSKFSGGPSSGLINAKFAPINVLGGLSGAFLFSLTAHAWGPHPPDASYAVVQGLAKLDDLPVPHLLGFEPHMRPRPVLQLA